MNSSLARLVRAAPGLVDSHLKEVKSLYSLPSNNSCGGLNGTELGDDSMGGLPQTLTLTSTVFVVLLVAFGLLRRDAFDSGRELIQRKWTNLIFRETQGGRRNSQTTSFMGSLSMLLGISDEMMLERGGVDAVLYLRLTRHLTAVVAVWTVLCLAVALPINMHGDLDGGKISFGETTLHNLRPDDPLLWALVALQLVALPLVWLALRMFLRPVCAGAGMRRPRTLMVSRVDTCTDPQRDTRMLLLAHFREAHPEQPVVEIQVALDVDRLMHLYEQHQQALEALRSARDFEHYFGEPLMMRPYTCANLCGCCACCARAPEVKAVEVYGAEERRLRVEVCSERRACAARPLPVAFVTFATASDACAVWVQYAPCVPRPQTSAAPRLAAKGWNVDIAPDHRDLLWEHLSTGRHLLSLRFVATNAALFIITFFLTTPALVVNLLDRLAQCRRVCAAEQAADGAAAYGLAVFGGRVHAAPHRAPGRELASLDGPRTARLRHGQDLRLPHADGAGAALAGTHKCRGAAVVADKAFGRGVPLGLHLPARQGRAVRQLRYGRGVRWLRARPRPRPRAHAVLLPLPVHKVRGGGHLPVAPRGAQVPLRGEVRVDAADFHHDHRQRGFMPSHRARRAAVHVPAAAGGPTQPVPHVRANPRGAAAARDGGALGAGRRPAAAVQLRGAGGGPAQAGRRRLRVVRRRVRYGRAAGRTSRRRLLVRLQPRWRQGGGLDADPGRGDARVLPPPGLPGAG